jgi:two-component system, OmpR family, phosphate regulon response regulator PhoB
MLSFARHRLVTQATDTAAREVQLAMNKDRPHARSSTPCTVLVVMEAPSIRELLAANLRHAGLLAVQAASSEDGRRLVGEVRPDVVIQDLDAASTSDTSYLDLLRSTNPRMLLSTVMVSSDVSHRCGHHGDVCGADICVRKPFAPRELVDKIVQLLRSQSKWAKLRPRERTVVRAGQLELDTSERTVTSTLGEQTQRVQLSPNEIRVLRCLMEFPDQCLTRDELVQRAWRGAMTDPRTVDQYIKRLRVALHPMGVDSMISTLRGLGYRFDTKTMHPHA